MIRQSSVVVGWTWQRLIDFIPQRVRHCAALTTVKALATALLLLLLAPAPSNAALMSAQDLLTACSGDAMAKATCDGYLMAATDLVLRRQGRGRVCVPATVTVDQVREAVLNVGQQGRAARAPAGLGLVAAAMRRTWPCEGEGSYGQPGANRGPWQHRQPAPLDEPGAPRDQ
jgi:Rap1a immunity proteins